MRAYFSAGHLLAIDCSPDRGLVDLVEDSNLLPITNPRQLRELLSPAEYRVAMDTTEYYNRETKRKWTWRARDYVVYDDSLIVTQNFSAKLVLMYDNVLSNTPGGDREYFFQIRTYTKDKKLIDQTEFATWSRAKQDFCDGVLTDDYFLIRSCDNQDMVKRLNKAGRFISPSQRMITWLKIRGY
ncbi:hypothetical protein ACFST9_24185 [Hymenobacter monticola]|uniref:Uncharacterized protein n=1 Tax=Hymenobacter monticola TaxID=1705399 RepID=A0ABY4B3S8_9BACT|nr:hypothetical protein [Hymenobacter monticola]UOE33801.1 hypothetical protein MTP16_22140 [Hymenobacter monticola]